MANKTIDICVYRVALLLPWIHNLYVLRNELFYSKIFNFTVRFGVRFNCGDKLCVLILSVAYCGNCSFISLISRIWILKA